MEQQEKTLTLKSLEKEFKKEISNILMMIERIQRKLEIIEKVLRS